MRRLNGPGITRGYLSVPVSWEHIHEGWRALGYVGVFLRREQIPVDRLNYIRHTETPCGVTALFRVVL